MKDIEKLSNKIADEICDAKSYAKMALEFKEKHPNIANTLYDISQEEIDHMNMLHDAIKSLIDEYRSTNGEPPAAMLAIYDYLHKQQIKKANKAKAIQAMFKEN